MQTPQIDLQSINTRLISVMIALVGKKSMRIYDVLLSVFIDINQTQDTVFMCNFCKHQRHTGKKADCAYWVYCLNNNPKYNKFKPNNT